MPSPSIHGQPRREEKRSGEKPDAEKSDPVQLNQAEAKASLAQLEQDLHRLQRSIRLAIQDKLVDLAGRSLGSMEDNRELAHCIHAMLDRHGLRVRCNECGHPAILRVSPRKGSAAGAFVFDHTIEGRRTFHGGAGVLPEVRLVAKPVRRKNAG